MSGSDQLPSDHRGKALAAASGLAAAIAVGTIWWQLDTQILNVVTYEFVSGNFTRTLGSFAPVVVAVAAILLLSLAQWRKKIEPTDLLLNDKPPIDQHASSGLSHEKSALPITLASATIVAIAMTAGAGTCFAAVCAMIALVSLIPGLLPRAISPEKTDRKLERWAPAIVLLAIALSTIWSAATQVTYWRHFMLGYADFGLFVTELEYCLPWKETPCRFHDTRMGYHCLPMFYALAPIYAIVRSPILLMIVGPFALNIAAFPFYMLAKARSRSATIGLIVAASWLLLPSLSRLPFASTYGFQSIYLAVPWLAMALCLGLMQKWKWSHLCLAGAVLCEETVCGVAFGWGVYLVFFSTRKRDGLVIAVLSLLYLVVSTQLIIPFFAAGGDYSRLNLFGETTSSSLFSRLIRERVWLFVAAMVAPMLVGIVRFPKLTIAALPTFLLVALLSDADYLGIKFWHHSTVLVVLFTATVAGVTNVKPPHNSNDRPNLACQTASFLPRAIGLLLAVLLLHQVMGFSPIAQSYRPHLQMLAKLGDDKRMQTVEAIRANDPPHLCTIAATERMAAHFCDYRKLMTANALYEQGLEGVDVIILDLADQWDPLAKQGKLEDLAQEVQSRWKGQVSLHGSVLVARKLVDLLPPTREDSPPHK